MAQKIEPLLPTPPLWGLFLIVGIYAGMILCRQLALFPGSESGETLRAVATVGDLLPWFFLATIAWWLGKKRLALILAASAPGGLLLSGFIAGSGIVTLIPHRVDKDLLWRSIQALGLVTGLCCEHWPLRRSEIKTNPARVIYLLLAVCILAATLFNIYQSYQRRDGSTAGYTAGYNQGLADAGNNKIADSRSIANKAQSSLASEGAGHSGYWIHSYRLSWPAGYNDGCQGETRYYEELK